MPEIIRIPQIIFEVEGNGSFERVEKIVQKVLDLAGISPAEDGGATLMHPVEDGSLAIRVEMYNLEASVEAD